MACEYVIEAYAFLGPPRSPPVAGQQANTEININSQVAQGANCKVRIQLPASSALHIMKPGEARRGGLSPAAAAWPLPEPR